MLSEIKRTVKNNDGFPALEFSLRNKWDILKYFQLNSREGELYPIILPGLYERRNKRSIVLFSLDDGIKKKILTCFVFYKDFSLSELKTKKRIKDHDVLLGSTDKILIIIQASSKNLSKLKVQLANHASKNVEDFKSILENYIASKDIMAAYVLEGFSLSTEKLKIYFLHTDKEDYFLNLKNHFCFLEEYFSTL